MHDLFLIQEILLQIVLQCPVKCILDLTSVSKTFNKMLKCNYIWATWLEKEYGNECDYFQLFSLNKPIDCKKCVLMCDGIQKMNDNCFRDNTIKSTFEKKLLYLPLRNICFFFKELCYLTNLTKLNLNGNNLNKLPPMIKNLSKLKSINLCCNKFTEFPVEIYNLTNLRKLSLNFNYIKLVPDGMIDLTQLRELQLSNNKLKQISDEIGSMNKLKILVLNSNQLTGLPVTCINRWDQLQMINVKSNHNFKLNIGLYEQLYSSGVNILM